MIRGTIGPKGRPGYLVPHAHGVINLVGDRLFEVDEDVERVEDRQGEPLVLTPAVFEHVRGAIRDGAPMFIEPLAEDVGHRENLEGALRDAGDEIARLQGVLDERLAAYERLDHLAQQLSADNKTAQADLGKALKRIADLEEQLAAAAKKKPKE